MISVFCSDNVDLCRFTFWPGVRDGILSAKMVCGMELYVSLRCDRSADATRSLDAGTEGGAGRVALMGRQYRMRR